MRIRKIRVSREVLADFFTDGRVFNKSKCIRGVPADAVLCGMELLADVALLAFTHSSFDDLHEGATYPEIVPVYVHG